VSLSLTVSQELEALSRLARQKQSLGRQGSTQREKETGAIAIDYGDWRQKKKCTTKLVSRSRRGA
jgi:hypothetical protein